MRGVECFTWTSILTSNSTNCSSQSVVHVQTTFRTLLDKVGLRLLGPEKFANSGIVVGDIVVVVDGGPSFVVDGRGAGHATLAFLEGFG